MKLKLLLCLLMITNLSFGQKDSTNVDNFQETDKVLSEVVKKALIVAEKTGDFVIEQAPLLLQEFYAWHITSHIFGIILSLLIFLTGRYLPYIWITYKECQGNNSIKFFNRYTSNSYYDDSLIPAYIIMVIGSITSVIILSINIYNLIYILVAPKLYLIDYFINQNQ